MTHDAGRTLVESSYVDAFRVRRTVPPAARAAVLAALGPGDAPAVEPVRIVRRRAERVDPPAELILEDGSSLGTVERLPRDLPHGYHRLAREHGEQLLLSAPRQAHPPDGRRWGWSAQLYATRSASSWGIGDLGDLRRLADFTVASGAWALLLNPLNAPNPGPIPEPSPYYPSTRRFRDPLYVRIDEAPGAELIADALTLLAADGRALNDTRRIERRAVLALKRAALDRLWAATRDRAAAELDRFRSERGAALRRWAVFCVLSERHGPGWRSWPEDLRDPRSAAVARVEREAADAVAFHEWVQWLVDRQLAAAAGRGAALVHDLPVGFDPGGFDAWDWQSVVADAASIGSPPDQFNPHGQDWGLPPFAPQRLRAAGHAPFVETVRAALRHAGGLRIDHILGIFRQWWVPRGSAADGGAYVRYPADELLAVLAIESERAGAIVIGEDLGTVEAGVRRTLRARGILSTRLAYFQPRLDAIPYLAQASITTHDLPTVAGVWGGADLAHLRDVGIAPDGGSG
jgi:4-alpha-glucanotransferase